MTDVKRSVRAEVVSSTFDEPVEDHTAVAEMALNRAKRLVGVISLGDLARSRSGRLAGRAMRGIAREGGRHMQGAAE